MAEFYFVIKREAQFAPATCPTFGGILNFIIGFWTADKFYTRYVFRFA